MLPPTLTQLYLLLFFERLKKYYFNIVKVISALLTRKLLEIHLDSDYDTGLAGQYLNLQTTANHTTYLKFF